MLRTLSIFCVGVVLLGLTSFTTPEPGESINWLTFEQAVEKMKTEKRKIFIDVYTDWCGWCKVMDKNTFTDPKIIKILNEQFYAVKFNAEQREEVNFDGKKFKFIESGRSGYHQLAAALLNNKMSYPNSVFLSEDYHLIPVVPGYTSLPGFQKPPQFHLYITYVGEDHYKKVTLDDFQKTYKSPYHVEAAEAN